MNRLLRPLPVVLAALLMPALAAADPDGRPAIARQLVADFSQQLRTALESAMQQVGPIAAIDVCREDAPAIAERISTASGWQVRRTALRVRNPANTPDEWERRVLDDFLQRHNAGEDIAKLSTSRESEGEWRYMQAIPTGQMCAVCHGSHIDPALAAHIRTRYPTDAATGFAPGSLRGAFSLRQRQQP